MNRKDGLHNLSEDAALRAAYRASAASKPEIDVWPRVSASLSASTAPRHRVLRPHVSQWAWGAAVMVMIAGVGLWHPSLTATRDAPPAVSAPSPPASPARLVVDTLADVPQVNPAVDDPARSSVEQIWVQLSNRPTAEAQTQ